MVARSFPAISTLAEASLTNVDDETTVLAKDLWAQQPCVVVPIRRPGCILCREEAQKVWDLKPQLDAMGVGLVALVHERIPEEVQAFHPDYWPGTLYHDTDKTFYKALGGGQVVKGSLLTFLNPFSEVWKHGKRAKETVKDSNLKGDGLTMGGLFVIKAGNAGVQYMHVEEVFGRHAPHTEVLSAAKAAAGK